jgi:hypothetical protein
MAIPNEAPPFPRYFDLLSKRDKDGYRQLQHDLYGPAYRNCRSEIEQIFVQMIEMIKGFCVHENADDWKRCFVCGIFWVPDVIVLNGYRLAVLTGKTPRAVLILLHRVGYTGQCTQISEISSTLIGVFPRLSRFSDWTGWVVRIPKKESSTASDDEAEPDGDTFSPPDFHLLSEPDQNRYLELNFNFADPLRDTRSKPAREVFDQDLAEVKKFCLRSDADDWKRCFVCGIFWLSDTIAMNSARLGHLMARGLSPIGVYMLQAGWRENRCKSVAAQVLIDQFPMLEDFPDLSEWTTRYRSSTSPQVSSVELPVRPPMSESEHPRLVRS